MGCGRPPRYLYSKYDIYTLYFYGNPDYNNTNLHYKKMLLTKTIIQGMLNNFYILSEKSRLFLAGGGSNPPPHPPPW